jgi:hypothetical protein
MSGRVYVTSFITLAVLFVPVLFFFGFGALSSPCCYAIYSILEGRTHGAPSYIMVGYLVTYIGFFFLIATGIFWVTGLFANSQVRTAIQVVSLLALFACSFIKAIEESGGRDFESGTYNFWTACARHPLSPRR